jgi:hypothetical protein
MGPFFDKCAPVVDVSDKEVIDIYLPDNKMETLFLPRRLCLPIRTKGADVS